MVDLVKVDNFVFQVTEILGNDTSALLIPQDFGKEVTMMVIPDEADVSHQDPFTKFQYRTPSKEFGQGLSEPDFFCS